MSWLAHVVEGRWCYTMPNNSAPRISPESSALQPRSWVAAHCPAPSWVQWGASEAEPASASGQILHKAPLLINSADETSTGSGFHLSQSLRACRCFQLHTADKRKPRDPQSPGSSARRKGTLGRHGHKTCTWHNSRARGPSGVERWLQHQCSCVLGPDWIWAILPIRPPVPQGSQPTGPECPLALFFSGNASPCADSACVKMQWGKGQFW